MNHGLLRDAASLLQRLPAISGPAFGKEYTTVSIHSKHQNIAHVLYAELLTEACHFSASL